MEPHVPRDVLISNVCPHCGGQVHEESDKETEKKN
jgi:hypothetical protein